MPRYTVTFIDTYTVEAADSTEALDSAQTLGRHVDGDCFAELSLFQDDRDA